MKKFLLYSLAVLLITVVPYSCSRSSDSDPEPESNNSGNTESTNEDSHDDESDYEWDEADGTLITLENTSISVQGEGVTVSGTTATITSSGYYTVTGTLDNGQLRVNTEDTDDVHIKLSSANITCTRNAPIFIESAEKAIIMLDDNTTNTLTDGTSYGSEEDANATLFSKSDLTIYGNGTLTVDANYNDAITSKDGLIISSGTYNVTSVDDGIRGKDYLVIKDGIFNINVEGDGFKSDNEESGLGYITIEYSECEIDAGGDAIQAYNNLTIQDGTYSLVCADGASGYLASDASAKGLKAGVNLQIDNGTFDISSADDAIHSNVNVYINNGTFSIASGDDGVHADTKLEINDGYIDISKCYEGLESAEIIYNGGTTKLISSDDGVNAADGSSSGFGGSSGSATFTMTGGYIAAYANGDGIDINGSGTMTAGTLLVHGPTSSGNGPMDYDGTFKISGGILVAAGSSGMAQLPSSSSSQASVLIKFTSSYSGGTLFNLQTEDGTEIVTFEPSKTYQSIVVSTPEMAVGTTYNAYSGGSHSGTEEDGLYSDGTYSSGSLYTSYSQSSISTTVGSSGGGGGGGPGGW